LPKVKEIVGPGEVGPTGSNCDRVGAVGEPLSGRFEKSVQQDFTVPGGRFTRCQVSIKAFVKFPLGDPTTGGSIR
jgi:hypothetical protein